MSQSRKINELSLNLRRAENSRDEWRRKAEIAANERDALKAILHREQGDVQGDTLWVGNCTEPSAEERHAPSWIGTFLATFGAFTIILAPIIFGEALIFFRTFLCF